MSTTLRVRRAAAVAMGFLLGLQTPTAFASGEAVPPPVDVAEPEAVAATPETAAIDIEVTVTAADGLPTDLPTVAHATFTTEIVEREPVDNITFVKNDLEKIFFFTDLRNLKGQTITHRWEHAGDVVSTVPFEVRGDRWRVWSSKDLVGKWLGEWKASVVTEDGVVIETRSFTFTESPAAPTLDGP